MKKLKTFLMELNVIPFPGNKKPAKIQSQSADIVDLGYRSKETETAPANFSMPDPRKINEIAKIMQKHLKLNATILSNRFIVFYVMPYYVVVEYEKQRDLYYISIGDKSDGCTLRDIRHETDGIKTHFYHTCPPANLAMNGDWEPYAAVQTIKGAIDKVRKFYED